ncbi:MAG: lysophospholipid acyltransferase family protein [Pseudomonadota bacterium]
MAARLPSLIGLLLLLIITIIAAPVQALLVALRLPLRRVLPQIWHKWACSIIGLRMVTAGKISDKRPLLLVANHVSWLDILALSRVGQVSFIAKREVSRWPLFGTLASLQETVFVNREKRAKTFAKVQEIGARLDHGDTMVLFAEGTSTSGAHVAPFRPALLGVANAKRGLSTLSIQPVAIAYTHLHGIKTDGHDRNLTGFYGDMDMASHLWSVLKTGAIDVTITFGQPLDVTPDDDRKQIAKVLEQTVRTMKTAALRKL